MNQTLALRKCILNDQNTLESSKTTMTVSTSSSKLQTNASNSIHNLDSHEYAGLLPAIIGSKPTTPATAFSIQPGTTVNFDAINKGAVYPPACIELVTSTEWLKRYGLRANRLNLEGILGSIGFKKAQDYVNEINQIISSKYSKGMFLQTQTKDGYIYNITVNENKLADLSRRLEECMIMFKLRLDWLNSDSRRLFGVIVERNVCLVVDCKNRDRAKFAQYKSCLLRLIREQVAQLDTFNIIRCSGQIEHFQEKAVTVSTQSIDEALAWINEWTIDFRNATLLGGDTITTEAAMQAFRDDTIEAVYLISEGVSSNGAREILYDRLVKLSRELQIVLNVVSFNCTDSDTIEFLRRIPLNSYGPGRFHAYCLLKQYDYYVRGNITAEPTKAMIIENKRMLGGAPPGVGVKSDAMLIYEEIQNAREALESVHAIAEAMKTRKANREIEFAKTSSKSINQVVSLDHSMLNEEYMSSAQWLKSFGISARHLDLFEFLTQHSFRHCDGVVDLLKEPSTGRVYFMKDGIAYYQGDSNTYLLKIPSPKLVNAKYCDQFDHVLWNDGTIMHVHVTPEMNRTYEERMKIILEQIEKRIEWLSRGSRQLFGTVIENNICILVDTSQSMQLSLEFVKRKLIALIQEQLKAKQRFNLIAFNSKLVSWRDRMVDVSEHNILAALDWINNLTAEGSTNTLAALRFALSDLNTEAIYLLTDGRPDQDYRQILSQVHLNSRVPIHTISFNCNDAEANKFLSQLAKETGGRYHYFNEHGWDADPNGPIPYESEDIALLKREIEKGRAYLAQLTRIREHCSKLVMSKSSKLVDDTSVIQQTVSTSEFSKSIDFHSKYKSKSSFDSYKTNSVSVLNRNHTHINELPEEQQHSDLLEEIQSLDWILPETRQLLERQYKLRMSKLSKSEQTLSSSTSKHHGSRFESKSGKFQPPPPLPPPPSIKTKKIKPISNDSSLLKSHSKIRAWLDKNSLTALKLTIFDVLLHLSATRRNKTKEQATPENMLVVDDMFEARVWNEILDLAASTSGIDKNRFKFINPSTIDLSEYQTKLENQIRIYRKYLADAIWKSLPEVEKTVLDNKAPGLYDESTRETLLKSLQYCNWPTKREDIEAFEREIDLAAKYLRLSHELTYYVLGKVESSRDKIESVNRELADAASSAPKIESLVDTVKNKTPRDKLLDDLRQNDENKMSSSKEEHSPLQLARGDRVIARNDLLGYFYIGKVSKMIDSRHANIKFENGTKQENMSVRNILKINGPSPYITPGDYVMASVTNEFEQKCYVPGIVQLIDPNSFPKLYTVLYFNGQEGENTRPEMIKISKSTYGSIVNYIRARLGLNTSVRTVREDKQIAPPPMPKARSPGPEIDDIKREIVSEIKHHFDSLRLDDKYQRMQDELRSLKKEQKDYKADLEGKLKVLRRDVKHLSEKETSVVVLPPQSPSSTTIVNNTAGTKHNNHQRDVRSDNAAASMSSSRELTVDEKLIQLRSELPRLTIGEEVLAKWSDDGWYYRSIVRDDLGNFKYQVEDSLRDTEQIYREDIVAGVNVVSDDSFEEGDPVVALHPDYEFSYAPGQIVRVSSDMTKLLIKFYDYKEAVVLRNEVFRLPRIKYQLDVENIVNLEKRWVGQSVIARNNATNAYEPGKVIGRIGNGRQYTIEWPKGKQSVQNANHLFGRYTRKHHILNNDYVLAPLNMNKYLPGRVLSREGDRLRVRFSNGKIDDIVSEEQCYWIPKDYYDDACDFVHDGYSSSSLSSSSDAVGREEAKSKQNKGRQTPVIDANEFQSKNGGGSKNRSKTPPKIKTNASSTALARGGNLSDDDPDSGADDIF